MPSHTEEEQIKRIQEELSRRSVSTVEQVTPSTQPDISSLDAQIKAVKEQIKANEEREAATPGPFETGAREFFSGALREDALERIIAGQRDPSQPVSPTIGGALKRAGTDPETGLPTSSFDFEAQEQQRGEELIRQLARRQAGKEAQPTAAAIGGVAGEVAPFLVPIPGIAGAKLATRAGAELARGAAVSAVQSEAPIGSAQWAKDIGIGGVGSVAGGAVGDLLRVSGKAIASGVKRGVKRGGIVIARDLKAKERVASIGAMQVKYRGKTRILNRLPFLTKTMEKIDSAVVKTLLRKPLSTKEAQKVVVDKVGEEAAKVITPAAARKIVTEEIDRRLATSGKLKKGAVFIGEQVALAFDATGGASTISQALIGGSLAGFTISELATAYVGIGFTKAMFSQLEQMVSNAPERLINAAGSKYVKPLRIALQAGPDAFKAAIVYASRNEDFQRNVIDFIGGEGTFAKIEGVETSTDKEIKLIQDELARRLNQ